MTVDPLPGKQETPEASGGEGMGDCFSVESHGWSKLSGTMWWYFEMAQRICLCWFSTLLQTANQWFLVLLRKRRATEMEKHRKCNRKQNTTWCHGISWPGWQGSITVSVSSANSAIRLLISNSFVSRESWHISENQRLLLQHQSRT